MTEMCFLHMHGHDPNITLRIRPHLKRLIANLVLFSLCKCLVSGLGPPSWSVPVYPVDTYFQRGLNLLSFLRVHLFPGNFGKISL